ncbi:MAG: M14 family zinc carboxypeptidase [Gemmatimonadota bacterium]|nr:M14 family zinc carboxypeptidase [Gemmatimonadota bacterium]
MTAWRHWVAIALGVSGAGARAAAQDLVPTRVRLDSIAVIGQLTREGFEVAGVERIGGVPYAVIVTTPGQRPALDALGFSVQAAPAVPVTPPLHFRALDQVQAVLDSLATAGLVVLDTIGDSWEGRPIVAAKIGRQGDAPERPNVLFLGAHHAREWISVEMALRLLAYLVGNPTPAAIVAECDVWVIPVVNPDGYLFSFASSRLWRKNRRLNADGTVGVDLNRNYPGLWGWDDAGSSPLPDAETYRGPDPASEPETQAVIAFHERHPPDVAVSYHSYSDLILYPYGHAPGVLPADMDRFAAAAGTPLAPTIRDGLPESARRAYHPGPGWQLYPTNGDYTEWAYLTHRTLAYTVELTAGCCVAGESYGFLFPDDSAAIARVVGDNLPFAVAVLESTRRSPPPGSVWEALWPEARLVTLPAASPTVSVSGPGARPLALDTDPLDRGARAWRWRAPFATAASGTRIAVGQGGVETQLVFADGAERETGWAGWDRDSSGSLEGEWHWRSTTDTLTSPEISLGGVTSPRVALWVRHEGSLFLPERRATVDVSTDRGLSWMPLLRLEGSAPAWYPVSADLPEARSVQLRVVTHDMPVGVDAVHVFGSVSTAAFSVAADELGVSENPVRSDRVIFTWQAGSGDVRLSVFTFTGLLMHRATVPAADGQASWNLTDLGGAPVGNGAYAVVLELGERVLRRRLFVARAR